LPRCPRAKRANAQQFKFTYLAHDRREVVMHGPHHAAVNPRTTTTQNCFRSLAAFAAILAVVSVRAQQATVGMPEKESSIVRLEEFEVTEARSSALSTSLTDSQLDALQPQSVISLDYIANNVAPSADYATIVNIAPSVSNVETNGAGLSEAKHTTLRGIDDGGYNVTFDGIPFGDYNSYSHHTTSYFPAKLIGRVVIDRGPGTASSIGLATFGGTMALYSKDPRSQMSFVPTLSFGSWGTRLYHFEGNTGLLPALKNGSAIASYQRMETDGYRTNADMVRDTYYFKYLQPLGKNTTLSVLSSVNKITFGNPSTVTQSTIDTFGRNFGLKDNNAANKLDLLNRRYNYQHKTADFEDIGLQTKLAGGWKLDNKVYTYSYNNASHEKPKVGSGAAAGTMLGSLKQNEYRTVGDSFAIVNESEMGTFKAGLWYDFTKNHRYTYGVNYDTTGADVIDLSSTALYKAAAPGGNPLTLPGAIGYDYKYLLVDKDSTFQPFAEYEWRATPDLSINAGVKYMKFTRDFNAVVNQTSGRQALIASRSDSDTTPSLSARYALRKDWSVYAQYAQGFMILSEGNAFYVDNKNLSSIDVKPQLSTNYQVGTVFKQDRFNADIDVYYIDFKNYAYNGPSDSSGDPLYYGIAGGAYYSGVEAQATYYVGNGLSVYANGSINDATFKGSKIDVPTVAKNTSAFGFAYNRGGFFGSFAGKYVGSWTVYDSISNPDITGGGAARSANSVSYTLADASVGYALKFRNNFLRSVKIRLQVSNLFDRKVQVLDGIDSIAANAYTKDTFNVLPTRNYFLTVSAEFGADELSYDDPPFVSPRRFRPRPRRRAAARGRGEIPQRGLSRHAAAARAACGGGFP
jgi:iron complex outermembrane receptor protein